MESESYSWEGNVRELRDCIEYLAHLDKKIIASQDIPFLRQKAGETVKAAGESKALHYTRYLCLDFSHCGIQGFLLVIGKLRDQDFLYSLQA